MTRPPPPGPGRRPGPEQPWYRGRPTPDDPTAARQLPPLSRRPSSPHRPPPPPAIPWYQRPPVRPPAPARAATAPAPPPPGGSTDTAARDLRVRWLLIGAAALAIGTTVVVIAVNTSQFGDGRRVLDVGAVQTGVAQILSDPVGGFGANAIGEVSCNHGSNPSAHKGSTFVCDVTVNGAQRQVNVLVSDDTGTYEIGRPH